MDEARSPAAFCALSAGTRVSYTAAERQRLKLLQPALFDEVRQEQLLEQQRLDEMEWELEHTYIERMKQLVVREQERVLEKVLPRRYALATVDVQPLAVEYIVHHSGGEPR
jgi:hypothetical protein